MGEGASRCPLSLILYKMKKTTVTLLFSCLATSMTAQGTLADYNRAYGLREKFSAKKILHSGVEPHQGR